MTIHDGADGLQPFEILRVLRFIKLTPTTRTRVLLIEQNFKSGALTQEERAYLRSVYNRNIERVRDLRKSEEDARISWNREKKIVSPGAMDRAKAETARRKAESLIEEREAEKKKNDLGI